MFTITSLPNVNLTLNLESPFSRYEMRSMEFDIFIINYHLITMDMIFSFYVEDETELYSFIFASFLSDVSRITVESYRSLLTLVLNLKDSILSD